VEKLGYESKGPTGRRRMRRPRAAESALATAGASGGTSGSPMPNGCSPWLGTRRLDEPEEWDRLTCIGAHLLLSIVSYRARRQHLADPVRRELEGGYGGNDRHALAGPPGHIGHDDIAVKVKLRLDEKPPAIRATLLAVEGAEDIGQSGSFFRSSYVAGRCRRFATS
jgi:hypothetical protein